MHIKKQTSFECYRRTKRCLMKLLTFIRLKRLSKKEDNRACWISTSRQLNKVKRHKQYPLPRIMDILRKRCRYEFFAKLDNSMQYYTFELDNKSQDSCTIITPFGKYGKWLYCPACSLSCMQIWYFLQCSAILYLAEHFNYECINFTIH